MIPRLGDGNILEPIFLNCVISLENDSPSRGRKLKKDLDDADSKLKSLENDSPSRGRKPYSLLFNSTA